MVLSNVESLVSEKSFQAHFDRAKSRESYEGELTADLIIGKSKKYDPVARRQSLSVEKPSTELPQGVPQDSVMTRSGSLPVIFEPEMQNIKVFQNRKVDEGYHSDSSKISNILKGNEENDKIQYKEEDQPSNHKVEKKSSKYRFCC